MIGPITKTFFIIIQNGKIETISKPILPTNPTRNFDMSTNEHTTLTIKSIMQAWILENCNEGVYIFEIIIRKNEKILILDIYCCSSIEFTRKTFNERHQILVEKFENSLKKYINIDIIKNIESTHLSTHEQYLIKDLNQQAIHRSDFLYTPKKKKMAHHLIVACALDTDNGETYYFSTLMSDASSQMSIVGTVINPKKITSSDIVLDSIPCKNPIDNSDFVWVCKKPPAFKYIQIPIMVVPVHGKTSMTENIANEPCRMKIDLITTSLSTDINDYAKIFPKKIAHTPIPTHLLPVQHATRDISPIHLSEFVKLTRGPERRKHKNRTNLSSSPHSKSPKLLDNGIQYSSLN
jgi:hypothetical protein